MNDEKPALPSKSQEDLESVFMSTLWSRTPLGHGYSWETAQGSIGTDLCPSKTLASKNRLWRQAEVQEQALCSNRILILATGPGRFPATVGWPQCPSRCGNSGPFQLWALYAVCTESLSLLSESTGSHVSSGITQEATTEKRGRPSGLTG